MRHKTTEQLTPKTEEPSQRELRKLEGIASVEMKSQRAREYFQVINKALRTKFKTF